MGEHVLAGQEDALEVDVVDSIPVFFTRLDRSSECHDADIVVKNVNALVHVDAVRYHGLHVPGQRHVTFDNATLTPFLIDDSPRHLGGATVDVDGEHLRSLAGEQYSRRLAVSPARTN